MTDDSFIESYLIKPFVIDIGVAGVVIDTTFATIVIDNIEANQVINTTFATIALWSTTEMMLIILGNSFSLMHTQIFYRQLCW